SGAAKQIGKMVAYTVQVVRMNQAEVPPLAQFRDRVTGSLFDRRIRKKQPALHVVVEHHLVEIVRHEPELLLTFAKSPLGALDSVHLTPYPAGPEDGQCQKQAKNHDCPGQPSLPPLGVE